MLAVLVLAVVIIAVIRRRRSRTSANEQTGSEVGYQVLHTATLLACALRGGLTQYGAQRALPHLAALLSGQAVALADRDGLLAWYGPGEPEHATRITSLMAESIARARPAVLPPGELRCADTDCPLGTGVAVPLDRSGRTVGALAVLTGGESTDALVLAAEEAGRWVSAQLGFADADRQAKALARAEVRALRAQISPHFIYNALSAIASFVRTDPDRARELIEEFAEFTRYSFRSHGDFTTLAERARSIDRSLPADRAGQVRPPAAGPDAGRAAGARGGGAVPVPAAAGGERDPARPACRPSAGSARSPSSRPTPGRTACCRWRTTASA
nr:histidine kinase [Fodinicola feengrottensis]